MANEYVIRIEDGTAQSSAAPVASQNGGSQETAGQPKQQQKANAAAYIASHAIVPMVKSVTSYMSSSVEISTGSRELQQKTDMVMSLVNTGMSTISTVAGAAAVFGPAGIGIGLAVSAINLATQYGIKQAQLQQQMRLEEEQLSLYRSRFGVSFNQSRTGGAT